MPERAVIQSTGRSWLRDLAWSRALRSLRDQPGNVLSIGLARRLINAWGDDATAVSPEYLVHCYKVASTATGTIIDFGAGVTTIVMAAACRGCPASVLALDHDPERRHRVLSELTRFYRRSADVRLAPIGTRDDVRWPAVDLHSVRRPIAFAACHAIRGLSDPHLAWQRVVEPALPDNCPVYFDPA